MGIVVHIIRCVLRCFLLPVRLKYTGMLFMYYRCAHKCKQAQSTEWEYYCGCVKILNAMAFQCAFDVAIHILWSVFCELCCYPIHVHPMLQCK